MATKGSTPRVIVDEDGVTWWSTRKVAEELGVAVQTIWNWLHVKPSRFPVKQRQFVRNKSMYFLAEDVPECGKFAKRAAEESISPRGRQKHTPEQEAIIRNSNKYSVAEASQLTGITPNTINAKRYRLRQRGVMV